MGMMKMKVRELFKKIYFNFKKLPLGIKGVNKALIFIIILLAVYLGFILIIWEKKFRNLSKTFDSPVEFAAYPLDSGENYLLRPAIDLYKEILERRDVFSPYILKVTLADIPVVEALGDLKLVGISWLRDPIVMIEDTKTAKTYFLKAGAKIENIEVKNIFKKRVIINFGGEEKELILK